MAKTSCIRIPEVNGKDSKLYRDILNKTKNRPQTNWLYASYTASNMPAVMSQQGYTTDANGEHRANDVLKLMDYDNMQNEIGHLNDEEKRLGAIDQNGQRIMYKDAKEALEKADAFNDSHKGLVAGVNKYGTGANSEYNIVVYEKNSRTHTYGMDVKKKLKTWDVYKHAFNAIGIDIENMPQELSGMFSPYTTDLVQQLLNLKNTRINFV